MKIRALTLLLALGIAFMSKADFNEPDFAYPQTVNLEARKILETSTNGLERLKAVMEIVKATTSITPDSVRFMPDFVARYGAAEKEKDVKALYNLYRAQVMQMSPQSNQDSINAIVNHALEGVETWGNSSLANYKSVINLPKEWTAFYPKLRDFIFSKAIALSPSESDEIIDRAAALSQTGSAEWVRWICLKEQSKEELSSLYEKYNSGIVGGYILLKITESRDEKCIELIKKYLSDNKENILTGSLQNALNRLTAPRIEIIAPEAVKPKKDFTVICRHSYTTEVGFEVFKLGDIHGNTNKKVKIGEFSSDTDPARVNDTTKFIVSLEKPGNYELKIVSKDLTANTYIPSSQITVTDWIPFGMAYGENYVIGAADFESGQPVDGITVSLSAPWQNTKKPLSGHTDSHGFASLYVKDKKKIADSGYISLSKGTSRVQFNDGFWLSSASNSGKVVSGAVFASRPLYHLGDTISFSAVIAEKNYDKYSSQLVVGKEVTAIFYDANYKPIDTIVSATDNYGRISGTFISPTDRLAGNYQISVFSDKKFVCSSRIVVSDFKMPVFEITGLNVTRNDTAYIVQGRAVRYSGSSVADAEVDVELKQAPLWWNWARTVGQSSVQASGKTLADGSFKVYVPISEDIPENGINYECIVNVTSINAETASSSKLFRVGKPFLLVGSASANEIDASRPVKLDLKTYNTDLQFEPLQLKYILKNGSDCYENIFTTDSLHTNLDWSEVRAGKYDLSIEPNDTSKCNSLNLGEIWIYNTTRNELPEELCLVLPENEIEANGDIADVQFGVGRESYVYFFTITKEGALNAISKKYAAGFHTVSFPVNNNEGQKVRLLSIRDGETYVHEVKIKRINTSRDIKLVGESWRDKLVPGEKEAWSLRLIDSQGKPIEGAMIATMYNESLNSLVKGQWPGLDNILQAPQKRIPQQFTFSNFTVSRFSVQANIPYKGFTVTSPQFLYLPDIVNVERPYLYAASMKYASRAESVDMELAEESFSNDMATGAVEEESKDEFDYREAETLQIFWMPTLTIDKNGIASINFTMPNAIGSWDFKASAWTKDMRAASLFKKFVSSKPVMVEPSLPRFLRQGDKVRIGATVLNNNEEESNINTKIEIFNPLSNSVLKEESFDTNLSPNGQDVVYIYFDVPVELESVGYRIKASNGEFSDGEQAAIPVLEASTIAVDSEIFYLNQNQTTFTTTIPGDASGKGIVAIEYCQNPVWDAVKALPGLYEAEPRTANEAAASLFAALTARSLLDKYPEIKQVLNIWLSNPADSSLVSDLEKNQDLKLATLAQTPFVGAANANTERMERFALTFNSKIIDKVERLAIAKLESLQLPDGCFTWGSWLKEPSPWITMSVLNQLGMLSDKEQLSKNKSIKSIIENAFGYLDNAIKSKKISDTAYAQLYSRYPSIKPSTQAGKEAIDRAVQNILKTWKTHSTTQKACDALILNVFGNKASSNAIMNSLEQFAQNSPRRGVSFPSVRMVDAYLPIVEAFSTIRPESKLLDGMRKWLVLQTQTTDNLASWNPTALVAGILSTGTNWIADPDKSTANVSIGGIELKIDKIEAATGYFSKRLPISKNPRAITFTTPATTNCGAYGSVISIATVPLSEVKPKSVEGLSVTKAFEVSRDGKWVEATEFKKGEKVRVRIDIEVSQNLEYVMISDQRPAGFEPTSQMPGWISVGNQIGYREITDTATNVFIRSMEPALYTFYYEAIASYTGEFASGTANVQSQYSPEFTARSGACQIVISD